MISISGFLSKAIGVTLAKGWEFGRSATKGGTIPDALGKIGRGGLQAIGVDRVPGTSSRLIRNLEPGAGTATPFFRLDHAGLNALKPSQGGSDVFAWWKYGYDFQAKSPVRLETPVTSLGGAAFNTIFNLGVSALTSNGFGHMLSTELGQGASLAIRASRLSYAEERAAGGLLRSIGRSFVHGMPSNLAYGAAVGMGAGGLTAGGVAIGAGVLAGYIGPGKVLLGMAGMKGVELVARGTESILKMGYYKRQMRKGVNTSGDTAAMMSQRAITSRQKAAEVMMYHSSQVRAAFGNEMPYFHRPQRDYFSIYR